MGKKENKTEEKLPTVTLNLSDIWVDENDLFSALKNACVREAKKEVLDKLSDKIDVEINKVVLNEINKSLDAAIEALVSEKMKSVKVKRRYSGNEETMDLAIENQLKEKGDVNSVLLRHIDDTAKKISKDLKNRYDLAFASHIVKNMHENNLLKEGVAESILNGNDGK